jgi:hypothetical protein
MRTKLEIVPGQPPKDAERVEIVRTDEEWNNYTLEDGSQLRIKQVATEVWRIIGEYDLEGNPLYILKTAGVMLVTAPENLKKKVN